MSERARQWGGFVAVYAVLAVFFFSAAQTQMARRQAPAATAVALYLCLFWLLGLALMPGFAASRECARRCIGRWAPVLFLGPYFMYVLGTGDFRGLSLAKLAALSIVPLALYRLKPVRRSRGLNWQDAVVLVWLAVPVLLRWIHRIWTVPVNLDFMTRIFLLGVGSWAFVVFRNLEETGYEFRLSLRGLRDALVSFACFSVIAIPLGLALGFIAWNPHWRGAGQFGFDVVTIFLFIALPEETFFRGALQNLLEGTWASRYRAQAVASVLFGFSHILHAPVPNWRYVLLASIAGWFYGRAWRNTRSLMASATTHALVDAVWRTWFQVAVR
jgi:hypothetical protein